MRCASSREDHAPRVERVALAGTGIAHVWTTRALERAGFVVVPADAQADLWVHVEPNEEPAEETDAEPAEDQPDNASAAIQAYQWRCQAEPDAAPHTLTSLYALVALLRSHAPHNTTHPTPPTYGPGTPATS